MDGACCVEDWHLARALVEAGAPIVYVRKPDAGMAIYRDGAGQVAAAMWVPEEQGEELPEEIRRAKAPR